MILTEEEARTKKCKMAGAGKCEGSDCMHWHWHDYWVPNIGSVGTSPAWFANETKPLARGHCGLSGADLYTLSELVKVEP